MEQNSSRGRRLERSDLRAYFEAGHKSPSEFGIGLEYERFGVIGRSPSGQGTPVSEPAPPPAASSSSRLRPGAPLPILGPISVTAILEALIERFGWQPRPLEGALIELSRGPCRITLEPGGQMELSGAVHPTIVSLAAELGTYVRQVNEASEPLGVRWLGIGTHPSASLEEIPWLSKTRYVLMKQYLPERGRLAHQMMKGTCGAQVNLDFADEADAMTKLRVALGLSAVVAAMFAHSPITAGRPNGYLSQRGAVWLETDPDRSGLLPFAFSPAPTFDDYVAYALSVPMLFLVRSGRWKSLRGVTFGSFLEHGLDGEQPTWEDWELHLSTLFPDVRLKTYIEVRGTDSNTPFFVLAHAALWKGLLYGGSDVLAAAYAPLADLRWEERLQLRQDVTRIGLKAEAAGRRVLDIARELVKLADLSLRSTGSADEARFLEPIKNLTVIRGVTPADELLELYGSTEGDLETVIDRVSRLEPFE